MSSRSRRLERSWFLLAVFAALTLLIQPWGNLVCQDDAGYALSALKFSAGHLGPHPLSLGMLLPQLLAGALSLKIFYFLPPLVVLNLLTWVGYLCLVAVAYFFTEWDSRVIATFFLMPLWAQYGASFLYEIYDALLLAALVILLTQESALKEDPKQASKLGRLFGIFILSGLLPVQQQTLVIFPALWGGLGILRREWRSRENYALLGGAFAGLIFYFLWPKGAMQAGFLRGLARSWQTMGFGGVYFAFAYTLQLWVGYGLFLIPLLDLRELKPRTVLLLLALQATLWFVMVRSPAPGLAAGVLFIDYLPRTATLALNSFGVWGLWVLFKTWDPKSKLLWGTLTAVAILAAFDTFRLVPDVRYLMIAAIPILFLSRRQLKASRGILGASAVWLALSFAVCAFTCAYNLRTNEARWQGAAGLEAQGVPPRQISAGYGRDSYRLAFDCVTSALAKLEQEVGHDYLKSPRFFETVYAYNTRIYELGWVPRYLIKPATLFGVDLTLRKNTSSLQSSRPVRWIDYKVLGIPHRLAVYESAEPQASWCFK